VQQVHDPRAATTVAASYRLATEVWKVVEEVVSSVARVHWVLPSWLLIIGACSDHPSDSSPTSLEAPPLAGNSGTACGRPPLPSCPLQQWMDANLAQPLNGGRLDRLVKPLEALSVIAPARYPEWAALARGGALAATRADPEGVRSACGACHGAYRERYRAEMRASPLPRLLRSDW
jgi:hypothetical protein